MTIFPHESVPPGGAKPAKRSVLGLLFNPQLGRTVKPLGESTRIFLHLLASVFSLYGLLPKDHPGLRDPNARMSLSDIMGTAWENLRFTRAGAAQVILFFAVIGIMAFGVLAAVSALLSIFIGHAHAAGTSEFILPGGNQDVAQAWLNYLFLSIPLPNYYNQMGQAIPTSLGIQTALIQVLAFYSEAILIIAAMILFYHLTAMVMETAHHGQVMGKRANQMWAPIRLVVAIGLLVPITTGGLNSGQYIVIKMASLGSALATNAWNLFLTSIASYNPASIPPMAPVVSQVAGDIMSIDACVYDYNKRVTAQAGSLGASYTNLLINRAGVQCNTTISGHPGIKYSFTPGTSSSGGTCAASGGDLADQDICGWYFVPSPAGLDAASTAAYAAEAAAFNAAAAPGGPLWTAATTGPGGINNLMPTNVGGTAYTTGIVVDPSAIDAVVNYQVALGNGMAAIAGSVASATSAAVAQLEPYGWVFAGALLNMVARIQAMISNAATAGMPETNPPSILDPNSEKGSDLTASLFPDSSHAAISPKAWDIRASVMKDMENYTILTSKTWAQAQSSSGTNAQCAAMIGLQGSSQGSGWGSSVINVLFSTVDMLASLSGVWTSGTGQPCGGANGLTTFTVGIQQIAGGDPLSEIAALGHANLDTAFKLIAIAVLMPVGTSVAHGVAGRLQSKLGGKITGFIGGLTKTLQGLSGAAGGILSFAALIFVICGFTLAYILPMFPFVRFFFAVLVWVAAVLEAVVAVPLIALAHLNPEGEGLPGQSARSAYFYVFNILLRPILMIFGLVCGLLLFLIAVSFLTYAFNLAVASSGGTAYGHELMSKIIYTIMYVVMLYVCANHSFSLIDHIPEKALSWMGAQAQSMAMVGNAGHVASSEMMGGSIVAQQMVPALTGTGEKLGNVAEKAIAGSGGGSKLPGTRGGAMTGGTHLPPPGKPPP